MNPAQAALDLWNEAGSRIDGHSTVWTPALVNTYVVSDLAIDWQRN